MSLAHDLKPLRHARQIFQSLLDGKHLDAIQDASWWSELSEHRDAYTQLFGHLGQTLVCNARGYAYFEVEDTDAKGTRPLALLYLLLFQAQSDAGQNLARFEGWSLDQQFWQELRSQNAELLRGARLDSDEEWSRLLRRAQRLGFMDEEGALMAFSGSLLGVGWGTTGAS